MKEANIHESLDGNWHITDNASPWLDERGPAYPTHRAAVQAARESETWTHYVSKSGRIVKLTRRCHPGRKEDMR